MCCELDVRGPRPRSRRSPRSGPVVATLDGPTRLSGRWAGSDDAVTQHDRPDGGSPIPRDRPDTTRPDGDDHDDGDHGDDGDRDPEEVEERRRYRELLEELRTMIPGAQVLLAFLLTVPFSSRFERVDETGKIVFVVSLACSAAATVMFLAPSAFHRLADRDDRRSRLEFGIRTAVLGLMLLGLAVALAIFVVVRFLYSTALALVLAGSIAVLATALWIVVPLLQRTRSDGVSELGRHR